MSKSLTAVIALKHENFLMQFACPMSKVNDFKHLALCHIVAVMRQFFVKVQ